MHKINYTFKIIYFFGILFIVADHCGFLRHLLHNRYLPIRVFHVGLFAFCSGYFYKNIYKIDEGLTKHDFSKRYSKTHFDLPRQRRQKLIVSKSTYI